jgi:hypothetical protein
VLLIRGARLQLKLLHALQLELWLMLRGEMTLLLRLLWLLCHLLCGCCVCG